MFFPSLFHHLISPFLLLSFLSLFFLATAPLNAADDAMTSEQRREVEEIVRQYLKENPTVILEAIEALRAQQQQMTEKRTQQTLVSLQSQIKNAAASPVDGNPDGDITIVEFFDYRCGFCRRVMPQVQELLKTDGNIKLVLKEFPILGQDSVFASKISLSAWKIDKEKYNGLHVALMQSKGRLSETKVLRLAEEQGYDSEELRKNINDPEISLEIRQNLEIARSLDISGTPAFIIGKRVIPGIIDLETMRKLILEARKG
jgi:protein-disulfide isomerase